MIDVTFKFLILVFRSFSGHFDCSLSEFRFMTLCHMHMVISSNESFSYLSKLIVNISINVLSDFDISVVFIWQQSVDVGNPPHVLPKYFVQQCLPLQAAIKTYCFPLKIFHQMVVNLIALNDHMMILFVSTKYRMKPIIFLYTSM